MLKETVKTLFRFLIWAAYASYKIEGVNALLLLMPAKLIVPTLRKYGAVIGDGTVIHSPLIIHNAGTDYRNLTIGSHSYFGRAVFLDLKDKISIQDNVTVSMRVTLLTHTDAGDSDVKTALPVSQAPVRIDSGSYVGASATILQGVHMHEGSAVGAGSVVLHDVPAKTIVAGNPAKTIKTLDA